MTVKKVTIDDQILDVIKFDEYASNPNAYVQNYTAIEMEDMVYPIRRKTDTKPGMYAGPGNDPKIYLFKSPDEEESSMYNSSNILDFSNATSFKDLIEKQNKIKSAERSILTTVDNIFIPVIGENDSPEMTAMKQAVIEKNIDLDKYEQRFSTNYSNDKRILSKPTITLLKMKTIANALDMELLLTIKDKNESVPNPIGKEITVILTDSYTDEEE